jgi:hypothetical protein
MNDNCIVFSPCTWTQSVTSIPSSETVRIIQNHEDYKFGSFLSTHFPITESKTHKMAHIIFLVVDILSDVTFELYGLCLLGEDDKKTPVSINFIFSLMTTMTGYTA